MEYEPGSSGPQAKVLTAMPCHFLSCLQVVFTISFNFYDTIAYMTNVFFCLCLKSR